MIDDIANTKKAQYAAKSSSQKINPSLDPNKIVIIPNLLRVACHVVVKFRPKREVVKIIQEEKGQLG